MWQLLCLALIFQCALIRGQSCSNCAGGNQCPEGLTCCGCNFAETCINASVLPCPDCPAPGDFPSVDPCAPSCSTFTETLCTATNATQDLTLTAKCKWCPGTKTCYNPASPAACTDYTGQLCGCETDPVCPTGYGCCSDCGAQGRCTPSLKGGIAVCPAIMCVADTCALQNSGCNKTRENCESTNSEELIAGTNGKCVWCNSECVAPSRATSCVVPTTTPTVTRDTCGTCPNDPKCPTGVECCTLCGNTGWCAGTSGTIGTVGICPVASCIYDPCKQQLGCNRTKEKCESIDSDNTGVGGKCVWCNSQCVAPSRATDCAGPVPTPAPTPAPTECRCTDPAPTNCSDPTEKFAPPRCVPIFNYEASSMDQAFRPVVSTCQWESQCEPEVQCRIIGCGVCEIISGAMTARIAPCAEQADVSLPQRICDSLRVCSLTASKTCEFTTDNYDDCVANTPKPTDCGGFSDPCRCNYAGNCRFLQGSVRGPNNRMIQIGQCLAEDIATVARGVLPGGIPAGTVGTAAFSESYTSVLTAAPAVCARTGLVSSLQQSVAQNVRSNPDAQRIIERGIDVAAVSAKLGSDNSASSAEILARYAPIVVAFGTPEPQTDGSLTLFAFIRVAGVPPAADLDRLCAAVQYGIARSAEIPSLRNCRISPLPATTAKRAQLQGSANYVLETSLAASSSPASTVVVSVVGFVVVVVGLFF